MAAVTEHGTSSPPAERPRPWHRLRCSRCRYQLDRPGLPLPGELDEPCGLCAAPIGGVTVFAVPGAGYPTPAPVGAP